MPVIRNTVSPQFKQVSQTVNNLPAYTVYSVKNVTCSHNDNGRTVAEMSCLQGPGTPDFNLSVEVVVKAMQKISGRSWCLLGFSNPLCGQELCSPQLQAWVGQDRPLTTEQWYSLHLTCPPHDSWVQSKGKYYRPVPDTIWNLDTAARELRPPEPPASTMPMSTVVAPDTYTGQGLVEAASLALACHNLGASTTCELTPPGHFQSTQPVHCDTVHMLITPAITDMTHNPDRDCHYTRLRTQARDRNKVLVKPHQDGTQSCLYHIVAAFVGQNMTQVSRGRDLGAWYLQPVNQARLCDMLPTNLQSPAEWSRRSRSALNPSNLADECDVYSLALFFDVSFQILSSTTSVQVINIQRMRGMIIGHVNSTRVKHFVGTKLLRNTRNVSSAVTQNTLEVPASQQNVTQSKRRKVNVPPDPAALFDTWPDSPSPGVAFGVEAPLSCRSVLASDSLPHTGSRRVAFDEVTLSHPQGARCGGCNLNTTARAPDTSTSCLHTHTPCHCWACSSRQRFTIQ